MWRIILVVSLSGCGRVPGRPGLFDSPERTLTHGRFSVDSYSDPGLGENDGYRFDVLKVDGEPIYNGAAVIQGGIEFCEKAGIDAVGVYLRSTDPDLHGTWVLQLQGATPRWTRLCGGDMLTTAAPWDGPVFHDPGCPGVVYDATTMTVRALDAGAGPPPAAPSAAESPPAADPGPR